MEAEGELEEHGAAGHAWKRGGSLKKRMEGEKGQKKARQEGCCSHWCSGKQEEGRPGKRKRMEDGDGQKEGAGCVWRSQCCVAWSRGTGGEDYWRT